MSTARRAPRWAPTLPAGAVVGRANQFATLETIMADTALSAGTKNAAWTLCQHLNGESGWTFTGLDRLAAEVGMRKGDMARHLAALEGGARPDDRHAPKRSAAYVYSVRFGQGYQQKIYRCFLAPEWVTQQVRDTRTDTPVSAAA
jgi:hypothetical protein